MNKVILIRYGEIMLKGLNRRVFEDKLVANIRKTLYGLGNVDINRSQARIYIEPQDEGFDFDMAAKRLVNIFGIVSISIALKVDTDFEVIKKSALEFVKTRVAKYNNSIEGSISFKVEAKRGYKLFPMQSPEICSELGSYLLENIPQLRVDVHNPDFTVYVEVRASSYIYCDIIRSNGGLPVGTNGKAVLLLSGGIDSPVAGWMMAKRGMELEAVHFHTYPYTSERAKEKVIELARILSRYCHRVKLHIISFTDIQLEINDKCPEELMTIIMRRVMMKIAERIAVKNGALALITGESLGQVASQTVHALAVTNDVVKMPVFRPLIGMDKNEVIEIARKIDTYETSILPYEDCCTVFVAKHPKTRPTLFEVEKSEELLQIEEMIEKAINDAETMIVTE